MQLGRLLWGDSLECLLGFQRGFPKVQQEPPVIKHSLSTRDCLSFDFLISTFQRALGGRGSLCWSPSWLLVKPRFELRPC